jgi:hypothetical protein
MAGVFASTVQAPRPLTPVDPKTELQFMAAAQRMFFLNYASNLMKNEPGTKPEESRQKSEKFKAEDERILAEMAPLKESRPEMYAYLARLVPPPPPPPDAPKPAPPAANGRGRQRGASTAPFTNSVFDAGMWIDGSDPDLTTLDMKPGVARDLHILPHGNVAAPGDLAPRQFLTVLSKGDARFQQGSGRRELAERLFTDGAPLAARVIVNRVWAWHFGKPLVATTSDFGTQGEQPTHPELLNDLAARFVASGWSLKWLHREIMLSSAYRQASHPREDGLKADATNHLIWRMNPRRLDAEAFRDTILEAAGTLDPATGGASSDLDGADNVRRTVYGRVSRSNLNTLLKLYDFPEASQHSPSRELTTTPLQQLFVMNSAFMQTQSAALAKHVAGEADTPAKLRAMYRRVLARDPTAKELDLALSYLNGSTLEQYAQALLSSNEVIFWP